MDINTILDELGGISNIDTVNNCMTRLRFKVKNESKVDEAGLASTEGVLGVVHDTACRYEVVVGPGKSRKYADLCHEMGIASAGEREIMAGNDWKANKESVKNGQKKSKIRDLLKVFGEIFVPLIPGTIVAGLCSGFAMLIAQLCPGYTDVLVLNLLYQLLTVVNVSFMTYIAAWAGYRAAERFGATPILGGMLGLITSLENVNTIAIALGLYNENSPLDSVLHSGKGGVLAAILGVYILSIVEKKIRKHIPDSMDIIFTPLLSMFVCLILYLFILMPVVGYISSGICWGFGQICMSEYAIVRAVAGFLGATLFLPLVATGMHHGLVALYTVQLEQIGYVTLYPALAMAGAGQVGAAIAIYIKSKKYGNERMLNVIRGALPAGFLGVGEPLIYGVTLPMGRPFVTAGLGAGFGGALVMLFQVASTTWGPSGILGVFVMTAGPQGAVRSILVYVLGLIISYIAGGIITYLSISPSRVMASVSEKPEPDHIAHGDMLFAVGTDKGIFYKVRDKDGIHARPAARLVDLAAGFDSRIVMAANDKETEITSVIGLMTLNVKCGTVLNIKAEGNDSERALMAFKEFLDANL
ncbi:MAG: HPr family phosphocarrier protein [Paludibacteraceae bacterium]|nr:HPr family phosphocarrier protein [Paludibacteraceae bacterium]